MKYDDASWHYDGDFPKDLPDSAGATHSGMFLAWAMLSGLGGSLHIDECPEDLAQIQSRSITPGQFFLRACDGKLTDEDLNDEGNAFSEHYLHSENGQFLEDYANTFDDDLPSLYHVPDSWGSYEKLRPVLDARYAKWRRGT